MTTPKKFDRETRELVELIVGQEIAGGNADWALQVAGPMSSMTQDDKGKFLVNLAFNAINSLSSIVQRAAAENDMDPLLYWATHVKLTNELSGD